MVFILANVNDINARKWADLENSICIKTNLLTYICRNVNMEQKSLILKAQMKKRETAIEKLLINLIKFEKGKCEHGIFSH